jgi:gas vesicle protein
MGKDPGEIRQELEESRERMGETVEALSYKADVPSRAKEYVAEKKEAVVGKVTGVVPDTQAVKQRAGRLKGTAESNPLGLAIGGAAVGFVAGLLIPATRVENERIGDMADELKEQAKEVGQEALERGKQVAQESVQAATETAREQSQEQSGRLAESLRSRTEDVTSSSGQSEGPYSA